MSWVRFDHLFQALIHAFTRYHSTPRDPDSLSDLAEARRNLDAARSEIADERRRLIGRPDNSPGPVRKFAVDDKTLAELRVASLKDANRGS